MKGMLGYQVDELAAALKMPLSFDPTTLIEIAVYRINREVKNRVYGKRQTANVRFAFMFSRKNEYMNENSAK